MRKTVCVITEDIFLFQKIMLDCPDGAAVTRDITDDFHICLFDIDTVSSSIPKGALTMSRNDGADIKIPFSLGMIQALLSDRQELPLTLERSAKCVYLRGEKIKLTEVEFSLLALLFDNGGEFVSRDEILDTVWDKDTDAGVINVYIHYLREKLEKHGEKIIISSRKCGYKIDGKYLEVSEEC